MGLAIGGVEADGLPEEQGRWLVLVGARRELSEQPVGRPAPGIEPNDVAQIGLRFEIAAKGDVRARPDQQQGETLGLLLQRIRAHRDDTRVMPGFEQLRSRRNHSSVHTPG
ncbi:MAG TPA: hypothetical protein VFK02_36025 [Kofleriaceae bacterium]|nr:hypothetical protein [Kofleriaceae bacterium]